MKSSKPINSIDFPHCNNLNEIDFNKLAEDIKKQKGIKWSHIVSIRNEKKENPYKEILDKLFDLYSLLEVHLKNSVKKLSEIN